jgi:hypothetical protein
MTSRDQGHDTEAETERAGQARVPVARQGHGSKQDSKHADTVAECVARLVEQAPPLTGRQRDILALLLRRTQHEDRRGAG